MTRDKKATRNLIRYIDSVHAANERAREAGHIKFGLSVHDEMLAALKEALFVMESPVIAGFISRELAQVRAAIARAEKSK